ncbi:MAG: hypothetical protein HZC47_01290 [Methanobacterium sp.]|uniref:hypothetical protein n=1 Tax=Methanobacterium sp. TaxID=2164 RepID=UPI003D662738|nr:hypothetical protein [Methanobacterium sp.]
MKLNSPIWAILVGIYLIFLSLLGNHVFFMAGVGIYCITTGIFEMKNYHNNKLYLAITGVILVTSLIITFIQLSSPLYTVNNLIETVFTIFLTFGIIIVTYDYTHDYKLSKIQINDQRPLIRYGAPIIGSIITLFIIIWLAYSQNLFHSVF